MRYFTAKNLEELRKEYKKLMVKNHPDNGGDLEVMKEINVQVIRILAYDRGI